MGWCEIEVFSIVLAISVILLVSIIAFACISARRQGGDINDLISSRSSGADRRLIRTYNEADCNEPIKRQGCIINPCNDKVGKYTFLFIVGCIVIFIVLTLFIFWVYYKLTANRPDTYLVDPVEPVCLTRSNFPTPPNPCLPVNQVIIPPPASRGSKPKLCNGSPLRLFNRSSTKSTKNPPKLATY
jgi:uncharacterized membrane protein